MSKPRVLFLCTGNSARSQMAEALLRDLAGERFEVFSAGTDPKGLHPLAVAAMREIGMDISGQQSKSLEPFVGQPWDYVITVCDRAAGNCPVFPGRGERLHWSFPDPAEAQGSDDQRMAVFRRVRDQIAARIRQFLVSSG